MTFWDVFVPAVLLVFAVQESRAITDPKRGDTLTERVRVWADRDTPGSPGGLSWAILWLTGLIVWVWFGGHVERWWP